MHTVKNCAGIFIQILAFRWCGKRLTITNASLFSLQVSAGKLSPWQRWNSYSQIQTREMLQQRKMMVSEWPRAWTRIHSKICGVSWRGLFRGDQLDLKGWFEALSASEWIKVCEDLPSENVLCWETGMKLNQGINLSSDYFRWNNWCII